MREFGAAADPGALAGAMIAGEFAIAWTLWGASGLSDGAAAAVRVSGIVIGVLILLGNALLQRPARRASRVGPGAGSHDASGSLFSSPELPTGRGQARRPSAAILRRRGG